MPLTEYGWRDDFARQLTVEQTVAGQYGRVCSVQRTRIKLISPAGEVTALYAPELCPVVGDWVTFRPAQPDVIVTSILKRTSKLSRKSSGRTATEQVVAANVDLILIVMGLDANFNLRRLERFLVMAWESGARPVVVLTKADLAADAASQQAAAEAVAHGVVVHQCCALSGQGLDAISAELDGNQSAVLVGSSGVGKSTLLNCLYGAGRMATGAVRDGDSKGRHTTTHRELVVLPAGGIVIDNPGIRELQPWDSERGLDETFADVVELGGHCRFRDCTHEREPGCAVLAAVAGGQMSADRLANYARMKREAKGLALRRNEAERRANDRHWGRVYKAIQAHKRSAKSGGSKQ